MSSDWLSFTGKPLPGLPALPSGLRFTGCTVHGLTSALATWSGTTRRPVTDRCEGDNSAEYSATEPETQVCRLELLLANQSAPVEELQDIQYGPSCLVVVKRWAASNTRAALLKVNE